MTKLSVNFYDGFDTDRWAVTKKEQVAETLRFERIDPRGDKSLSRKDVQSGWISIEEEKQDQEATEALL